MKCVAIFVLCTLLLAGCRTQPSPTPTHPTPREDSSLVTLTTRQGGLLVYDEGPLLVSNIRMQSAVFSSWPYQGHDAAIFRTHAGVGVRLVDDTLELEPNPAETAHSVSADFLRIKAKGVCIVGKQDGIHVAVLGSKACDTKEAQP